MADLYLVPFNPRSFDVWTLEKVARLIQEIQTVNPKLRSFAFINRADPHGSDNQDAAEALSDSESLEFLDAPLGNRKAYANAAAQGLGVLELQPEDTKASAEFRRLLEQIKTLGGAQ